MNEKKELRNRNFYISGLLNEKKVYIEDAKMDIENMKVDIESVIHEKSRDLWLGVLLDR